MNLLVLLCTLIFLLTGCIRTPEEVVVDYELSTYDKSLFLAELNFQDLCVTLGDVNETGFPNVNTIYGGGLFDVTNQKVLFGQSIFQQMYPASLTKVMTALVASQYGNLDDFVTVSPNAVNVSPDSSLCYLASGDVLTLRDLINGLMLQSGNDAAVAIAEHIAGSETAFVELMNKKAQELMATGTHYINSHGLHDENHYTTPYDMYLIFNAYLKNAELAEIAGKSTYSLSITQADQSQREVTWTTTSLYKKGEIPFPSNYQILGNKTGTTLEAGNCLLTFAQNSINNGQYIVITLGAEAKNIGYETTTGLLESVDYE
nr:serine hydrolase [Aequitasia blattaphilus]